MTDPAVAFASAVPTAPMVPAVVPIAGGVFTHPPHRRRSWHGWTLLVLAVVGLFTGLFLLGELPRRQRAGVLAAAATAESTARPRVRVVAPRPAPPSEILRLPGTVVAARATGVYPRVGGYVVKRLVEIGQTVAEGEVLAEIDAIDAVQQLAREEGVLAENRATVTHATVTRDQARLDHERSQRLGPDVISRQAIERNTAAFAAAEAELVAAQARVVAQEAEVRRLRQQASFARVIAPFAGVITARSVEVGNLIPPGGGSTPLFQLAQSEPLRVLIDVPQTAVAGIKPGVVVEVAANGATVRGTVARTAGVLDTERTMRAEIELPVGSTGVVPGMYVQAALAVPLSRPLLVVTADAILFSGKGTQVAVLDADDRVHLRAVTVISDTGTEVLIGDGLTAKDRVVANPGGVLAEGTFVTVVPPPTATATK